MAVDREDKQTDRPTDFEITPKGTLILRFKHFCYGGLKV